MVAPSLAGVHRTVCALCAGNRMSAVHIKEDAMSEISRRSFVRSSAIGAMGIAGAMGMSASAARAEEASAAPAAVDSSVEGTFTATAKGFAGDVTVTATFSAGVLTELVAEGPQETSDRGGKAIEQLPAAIVGAGGTAGVDVLGGATMTSSAVLRATDDCFMQAGLSGAPGAVKMKPGIYCGKGQGFDWIEPVQVKIEVDETSLLSVEVIERELNREEPVIMKAAEDLMIPRMIENQSVTVDSICGATSVSAGIKAATEDALKKALKAGGSAEDAIKNFYVDPVYSGGEQSLDYDVVVCGMGGAGCAAAMSVAEAMQAAGREVSVLALETAGKYGGTASNAGEPFSINAPRYIEKYNNGEEWCDAQSLYDDWITSMSIGTPCKPDIVQLLFDESGKTVDWLQFDHGFVFTRGMKGFGTNTWLCKQQYVYKSNMEEDIDYAAEYPDYTFGDRSTSVGQYYDRIVSDYVALGGEYMLETTAYELLYDAGSNRVTGVKARSNVDHAEYTINAKVVIMCTGGFGGNADLEVKYLQNPEYPLAQPWKLWGMAQNKGQMIESAINQGMATYNLDMPPCIHFKTTDTYLTDFPVYYRDGLEERMQEQNVWSLNDIPMILGISTRTLQVGTDGVRHYNEAGTFAFWAGGPTWFTIYGSDYIDQLAESGFAGDPGTYTSSTKVFGQGGYPNARPIPQIYEVLDAAISKGYVYKAETLEELAGLIEVPVDDFVAQVERYRGFCENGEDLEFGRDPETLVSNINYGPYYAITCKPVPYATLAAMDVDSEINVLLPDGSKVGGLYACGNDSGGVIETNLAPYAQYGGVALGWAFTSGRLAGINAVNYLQTL